jgi:ATP-dependent RNA helicase SUPV3L1/SUV3
VRPLGNDLIDGPLQDRVADRLAAYVRDAIDRRFRPLFKARDAKLAGAARGLVFQLVEAMGSLPRHNAAKQIASLTPRDFGRLRRLDVRIGREMVYIPAMLRPDAAALAVLLWSVQAGRERIPPPPPGRVSLPVDDGLPDDYYAAAGYRVTGPVAIRVDILERLIGECRRLAQIGQLQAGPALLNLVGCTAADMDGVLVALGYTAAQTEDGETRYTVAGKRTRTGRRRASAKNKKHGKTDGPFAKLKDLAAT